jgi:hypothetical protein
MTLTPEEVRRIGHEFALQQPRFIYDEENCQILVDAYNAIRRLNPNFAWTVENLEGLFTDLVAEKRIKVRPNPNQNRDVKIVVMPKKVPATTMPARPRHPRPTRVLPRKTRAKPFTL